MAPDPTPSPKANGAGPSAASPTASPPASTSDPLVDDAGPAFDPAAAAGAASAPEPAAKPEPGGWQEEQIKQLLTAKGAVLHGIFAVNPASTEWVYTDRDLRAIAPPLTRILNRYDATRIAAETGDELAVVIGVGGYGLRSYLERRRELEKRDQDPRPITGRPDPDAVVDDEPVDDDVDAAADQEPIPWTTNS